MASAALIRVAVLCVALASTFALEITIDSWNGGFKATPCVNINKNMNGWKAHVQFNVDVDSIDAGSFSANKMTSRYYRIDGNTYLGSGHRHCFTLVASCSSCSQAPTVSVYVEGNRSSKNYAKALELSLLFYATQRSGKLPSNNPISWRGDSATDDCVPGGWYDAGDHVKFGFPMASSTTLLTWSLMRYKAGYQRAGKLNDMYDSIKWPLEYFLKAWDIGAQTLVVQVGDGYIDHKYWVRAEDMKMKRPCQKVSAQVKGSDIAAETAASLAAGSIVFQDKGDYQYQGKLLHAAKTLYKFAKENRGCFTGSEPFYKSTDDADEMCLGAMFLYKATKDNKYLEDAKTFANWNTAWGLTWDNKMLVCQMLLFEETGQYKEPVQKFFKSWSKEGGMTYTPCGLAWRDKWGTARYAGNAAFAALVAADLGLNSYPNRKWAVEQINYILGDNNHLGNGKCFSFQVGYGKQYPHYPHHRGASCPNPPKKCGHKYQWVKSRNYHVLKGALVGGPEANGNYQDVRTNYEANEVTTDYNAGFQGALAALLQLETSANFPWAENKCRCFY